ncbi:MAG: M23 family metallopeptidase [Turicibacter sp.]|nr:M23 family metallopeptidase [Turicibacter sp.]
MRKFSVFLATIMVLATASPLPVAAKGKELARNDEPEVRLQWYKDFAFASGVPWYQIAAVDQFERNIFSFREEKDFNYNTISIVIPNEIWSGSLNPDKYVRDEYQASLFGGIAKDGDGDGIADINNEEDVMYTMVEYLRSANNFENALMGYYQNEQTVKVISEIASLFKHYNTNELSKRHFPVSLRHSYSYTDNYGAARGWGGRRSHEGIDVFAGYMTPVLSTAYGVVELIGWNEYGGYRIGIRDMYNTYQYYAHLHGYEGSLKEGDIVEPGQIVGYVGSTGYGKEGTSGKFPPHLHFGLYKYDGDVEWAFNPYPHMIRWERESRKKK